MVKHFNVIMAGLIAGIVALFTSWLGVSGTVIGSVISSFLYQFFSTYSAEKYEQRLEEGKTFTSRFSNFGSGSESKTTVKSLPDHSIGSELVYVFPLVIIAIIELISILASLHYRFDILFNLLEAALSNNLFRFMGIGLIALGIYPLLRSTNISKTNGVIVLFAGIFLLLRGLIDISPFTVDVFYKYFYQFDLIFAVIIIIALVLVIINILRTSIKEYNSKRSGNHQSNGPMDNGGANRFSRSHRKSGPRKIDTGFHHSGNGDASNIGGHSDYVDAYADGPIYDDGYGDYPVDYDRNIDVRDAPQRRVYRPPIEEDVPIYEEEIIYVNNPDDPNNPIRKRILKKVDSRPRNGHYENFDDTYIMDEK